jgi:SAM-dependent methyltransferase
MSQEKTFIESEADAWTRRNPPAAVPVQSEDSRLVALAKVGLPDEGALIDVGGASGQFAAGFLRDHAGWSARVVEPSGEAIRAGQKMFPAVEFNQGSIANPLPSGPNRGRYDVVVVSGVLCWVERDLLSRAVANTDAVLADGGLLLVADFDSPSLRVNPYRHAPGLFTYKQDYAQCFLSLGLYHLQYRCSEILGSIANVNDPYDRQWMIAVLRKDFEGRYVRSP